MSMNETPAEMREKLEQEAVNWHVRMASGDMTATERAAFESWQLQSPEHARASRKIERLWQLLPAALLADELTQQRPITEPSATVIDFAAAKSRSTTPRHKRWLENRIGRWSMGLATAASLLVAVCIMYCGDYLHHPLADYRTLVGEQQTLQLADGSTVYLNTDSAIDVTLTDTERRIVLLKGEAEFDVAHDTTRPFKVISGHTTTEALGTKFIVRYANPEGSVTLLEGKIRTTRRPHHGTDTEQAILSPGEQITFTDEALSPIQKPDMNLITAWRRGRLVMNFVTLETVVAEINRYRSGHVLLLNAELAKRKVHVALDIDHIDDWINALENTLPLHVRHVGHIVYLQPS